MRWGIVAVGLLLVLPALGAGFFGDDYMQIAQIERWSLVPTSPLDLYVFVPREAAAVQALRDGGTLPWFAAPDLKIAFLRPLSSGLMWLDHALFGRWALPYHVHTLLWFAGLLAAAAALLRRLVPGTLAVLALAVFCLDESHVMAAAWVAARNATVSCAFVFAGTVAHLRWRTEGWRPGALLAPLALALGLAGGEMGLAAMAYLFAWELLERRPGWRRALLPALGLGLAYVILHRLTGSGARAGGGYLDPFGDPLGFLAAVPERVLLLLGNLLVASPVDLALFDPGIRPALIAAGAGAALLVGLWLRAALRRLPAGEARALRVAALGAGGALLVSVPALVGERVLLAASLGGAVVIAALLRDAWRCLRAWRMAALAAAGLLALGIPNLVLAGPLRLGKVLFARKMFGDYRRLAAQAEIAAPVPARVVVVALPDLVALHLPVLRVIDQQVPPATLRKFLHDRKVDDLPLPDRVGYLGSSVLSLSAARHRLRRTGPATLELSTPAGTLLDGAWAQSLRAPSLPLARGQVIPLSYLTATVLEDRGGRPTRVEFRFDRPVDDPSLVFLALSKGGLRRLPLPPVGREIDVPQDPVLF